MRLFESQVYPVWAPIVSRNMTQETNDKNNDCSKDFDNLSTLHECDLAIFNYGVRPDRMPSRTEAEEKKDNQKRRVVEEAESLYQEVER